MYGDFNFLNMDGIDIDFFNNIVIKDCYIDIGDDVICFKLEFGFFYNLIVINCWI